MVNIIFQGPNSLAFTFGSEFKRQPGQLTTRAQGPCQGAPAGPVPFPSAKARKESRAKAKVNMAGARLKVITT
jgi:hypothetical protein